MRHVKDPDAVLDYARDWDREREGAAAGTGFLDAGETITTSTWALAADNPDTDLTINSQSHTATTATLWLAGGTVGVEYRITNRITTSAGRTDDRTDTWKITER